MVGKMVGTMLFSRKVSQCMVLFLLSLLSSLQATLGQAAPVYSPPKSITVVMDDNYPPYIFRSQGGEPQGLLVDEWRLWSQVTGVGVNLVATDWEKAQQIMAKGDADVIDTIFFNEQRAKVYDFTRAYAKLEVPVYVHKSLGGITGVQSLQGFTIGVKAGDACIDVLRENGITTIREFYSYEDVIRAAGEGTIKVFCVDMPPAVYYLYKFNLDGEFRYGFTLYTGEFHRAVKKGQTGLLRLVEQGFEKIDAQQIKEIERKWLGTPLYNAAFRRILIYSVVAVSGLILMLSVFTIILKRKIWENTAELNEMLDALRKSDERWQFALEGAGAGVWDWNMETGKVYFSDRWKSLLGYDPHELKDSFDQWKDLLHPDDANRAMKTVDDYFAGKMPDYFLEHRLRCKDGRYKWILAMGKIVARDSDGTPLRMIGTHNDISDRKETDDSLRKALTFNEMILKHSPVGILVYDGTDGGCVMANQVAAELMGVGLDELQHGNLSSDNVWNTGLPSSPAARALAGNGIQREDLRLRPGSGTDGMADCTFARVEVDGAPFLLIIAVDIAERVRMYEIMAETEKIMSVGGLAAGMAHEINNPLSGILQSVQNVRRRLDSNIAANENAAEKAGCSLESIREYCHSRHIFQLLDAARDSGQRAARIVSNMLQFSRKPGLALVPVDVNALLENSLELCANDYDLKKKYDFRKVEIERDYSRDMPPVPCTETQIEQVLVNILRNAAQALSLRPHGSPSPRIVLRTRLETGMARIEIADNGGGMDETVSRKVFEPFFTTKAPGAGTGLGLSVSYFIIASNHKGTLEVASQPGVGTTFTIRLPLKQHE
jgi:PAS domain S-box-containing protein